MNRRNLFFVLIFPIISSAFFFSCSTNSGGNDNIPIPENLIFTNIKLGSFSVTWSESQFAIRIQASVGADFSAIAFDQQFSSAPAEVTQLDVNTTYFIRAQYIDGNNSSEFSEAQQVSTLELLSPNSISASEVTGDSFRLSWGLIEDATYELQVGTDQDFMNLLPSFSNKELSSNSSTLHDLNVQSTYFFRVRSVFGGEKSDYVSGTIQTTNELNFKIFSSAFDNNGKIPAALSCSNVSPHLTWRHLPPQTVAIAITMDDLDFQNRVLNHWVTFNIPPATVTLEENASVAGMPQGSIQATNGLGNKAYFGPCPPQGETHRYRFRIYALSENLNLDNNSFVNDFLGAINGKVIDTATLMGNFR